MTLITPKNPFAKEQKDEQVESQIPTDSKGIKEYLNIIPTPVGYRMLVRPWSGKKKTKGGIILSDETNDKIAMTTEGQFVIYGRYSGSRFQTKYGEHRILNDDEIIGTIKMPEDILHLF